MRRTIALGLTVLCVRFALASDEGYPFDITVNDNDASTTHFAATIPQATSGTFQVNDHLIVEVDVSKDSLKTARLIDTTAGGRRLVALLGAPAEAGATSVLSFSECGDHAIALDHARPFRQIRPGRCADLPPIAKPDRIFGQCRECAGAYEGMPAVIEPRYRIARPNEPGEPLLLTGRALGADGRPRKGVIVYAYQADDFGNYPQADPPRSDASQYQGALRGWARTDAHGRYTFDTIRPGIEGDNPQHIHMLVIEPGCAAYYIDEINFTDDPVYQRLPEQRRRNKDHRWGGTGLVTPVRKGRLWEAARDIQLGENIRNYTECPAAKSQ